MRLLLDVTRTLAHLYHPSRSGIDRVEDALVRRLAMPEAAGRWSDLRYVVLTPGRQISLSGAQFHRILAHRTRIDEQSDARPCYRALVDWLESANTLTRERAGAVRFEAPQPRSTRLPAYWQILKAAARASEGLGPLASANDMPTAYLHVSHILLEKRHLFRWLERSKVRPAFFLHDLIPVDFPEFCGAASTEEHKARIRAISASGELLLVNSKATAERLARFQAEERLARPPVAVVPLPGDIGPGTTALPPPATTRPYFLCAGTIEGRKNIGFLLNLWRGLTERLPSTMVPRLVIAGRRGWACDDVLAALDRSRGLSGHVAEANGFTDAEIVALMRGAAGVLAPSLAEGFGLVPAEAAALGVPVVASDIAAHREALAGRATLLDPTDGRGWRDEILRLAEDPASARPAPAGAPGQGWLSHADQVLGAVRERLQQAAREP